MKKQILAVTAVAMIFASCQKSEETQKVTSKYISVEANMGTLSSSRATATGFEKDDQISIYAWAGADLTTAMAAPLIVDNSKNTFDGATTWTAAPQMLWKDMVTPHFFTAIYPVQAVTNFTTHEFTLIGDQAKDDLLFATNHKGLTGNSGLPVPLTFSHSQSKLIVNLTFRDQFGTVAPKVDVVTVLSKNVAVVDFTAQKTTAKEVTAVELSLPATTANVNFGGVVVPQTINKITITIAGKDYIYENTTGIALEQGKTQTLNLTVGRDVVLIGDVTISDWASNGTIIDGEAGEKE